MGSFLFADAGLDADVDGVGRREIDCCVSWVGGAGDAEARDVGGAGDVAWGG